MLPDLQAKIVELAELLVIISSRKGFRIYAD